jgi:hypothetical protein
LIGHSMVSQSRSRRVSSRVVARLTSAGRTGLPISHLPTPADQVQAHQPHHYLDATSRFAVCRLCSRQCHWP